MGDFKENRRKEVIGYTAKEGSFLLVSGSMSAKDRKRYLYPEISLCTEELLKE